MEILKLNRMNDALFKNIFAQNSDITLSLINSVFEFQGTELITDIEFIDRNLDIEEEGGKVDETAAKQYKNSLCHQHHIANGGTALHSDRAERLPVQRRHGNASTHQLGR